MRLRNEHKKSHLPENGFILKKVLEFLYNRFYSFFTAALMTGWWICILFNLYLCPIFVFHQLLVFLEKSFLLEGCHNSGPWCWSFNYPCHNFRFMELIIILRLISNMIESTILFVDRGLLLMLCEAFHRSSQVSLFSPIYIRLSKNSTRIIWYRPH